MARKVRNVNLTDQEDPILTKVRLARRTEVLRIRKIEDEAGKLFYGLGLMDESKDESFPLIDLARLIDSGLVWVCSVRDEPPVGMIIASVLDTSLYIEEMGVLPSHGRRGIGTRLLKHVCSWAQQNGFGSIMLSTFSTVPWNAPFYRKNGFRDMKPDEWSRELYLRRDRENARELATEFRVFMKMDLVLQGAA